MRRRKRALASERGFTLVELTVALGISTSILLAVLSFLDMAGETSRLQINLAEVQQNQRAVHNQLSNVIRTAGRGGLPSNLAVNVADNVPDDFTVAGNPTVDGSDVLRIRGLFETLLVVDTTNVATFGYDAAAREGFVVVDSILPTAVAGQNLDHLERVLSEGLPVPLMMVSARSNETYAVAEIAATSTIGPADVDNDGSINEGERRAVLRFSTNPVRGTHNQAYMALSSSPLEWPEQLTRVGVVGILQEYQYYLREPESAIDGGRPTLSRASLYPGTDIVAGDAADGRVALADGVVDLQFARAFDADLDFQLDEDEENPESDEWLGNHPDDEIPSVVGFAEDAQMEALGWPVALLSHVQVSTLTRVASPALGYVAPAMDRFENRNYDELDSPTGEELLERRYRRRQHRTVVSLRNLPI